MREHERTSEAQGKWTKARKLCCSNGGSTGESVHLTYTVVFCVLFPSFCEHSLPLDFIQINAEHADWSFTMRFCLLFLKWDSKIYKGKSFTNVVRTI